MFHTICLFKNLSLSEYMDIDSKLSEFSKSFLVKEIPVDCNKNKYVFRRFGFAHFKGLEGISMYITKKKNFLDGFTDTKSYLHLVINPKAILNKDYISVANEIDGIFAFREIDKLFYRMEIPLTCADFKTSRIDCCCNIQFLDVYGYPCNDMATDYISIQKKGKIPIGFNRGAYYSESGKRFVPFEKSIVYTQSRSNRHGYPIKSVAINIYHKHDELEGKSKELINVNDSDDEDDTAFLESINYEYERDSGLTLNNANGIVRFEVQLYYPKLYNTARSSKWDFNSLDIGNFISDHFTESMLLEYLGKTSFTGDYYTLEKAREIINNYPISHKRTKEGLLTLLSQVSRQRSWNAVYENTCCGFPPNTVNNLLRWLDKIGVNVVTIPKGWSSEFFPSPISIINNAIQANAESHPYETVPLLFHNDLSDLDINSFQSH